VVDEAIVARPVLPVRNRVQWGPIVAGVLTAIVLFLLLTILGLALGASVLDPANTAGEIGTWAAVWGAITAIVSFLIGGWIATRSAVIEGTFAGLLNGLCVGIAGLLLIIWLTASGLGNLFGTIGSTVGSVLNVAASVARQQATRPTSIQSRPATRSRKPLASMSMTRKPRRQQSRARLSKSQSRPRRPCRKRTIRKRSKPCVMAHSAPL
jgi:hypothetical protein